MEENVPVIYAAPLQGFTETAWRNAHAQSFGGVDAYYTPFIRLEKGEIRNKDKRGVSPGENTVPRLIPQIIASEPDELEKLVTFLMIQGYREIDLNMGCPFPLIVRRGKGSGILSYPEKVAALLEAMKTFPEVCFSVKMRLGWENAEEWRKVLPLLNRSCVKQVTLHPRIGKQQYKGVVDMEAFRCFYEACELPLVYNGDLCTVTAVREILEAYPRLKGVMLGRGLLADPSLAKAFREEPMSEAEIKARTFRMHRLMYLYYQRIIEGGDAQLLTKLKAIWEYLLPDLDKKVRKAILKSNRLDTYLRAVEDALG
ncbi:tRNA-dihydrouridine synthase family protein [uncultured Phocaeicola sp.]|mgnify:FL=1|uniref:tRNA-dihydrouridine synthase family protein n=1 Tax=uncultured Phocaeicola sp. TaxID=990718 RepID=UPI0025EA9C24|nr:tRNA-dihydrouridine synthase family protein [uncultured Phocaeicola sp.]